MNVVKFYVIVLFYVIMMLLPCNIATFDYMEHKPNYIESCQFSDPEFTQCSTRSVQKLIEQLIIGIDGIDNLPAVDPMRINRIRIFQGTGPVSVNASLTKVTITGFSNAKVLESKVSSKDFSWETRFILPKMRLDGTYDMKGRILIIPLSGHGKLWIEATNLTVIMYTKTNLYEKFDHVFYNITQTKINFDIGGLRLRLDNLFEGIKSLEDSTNQYLNDNWRIAAEALKPIVIQTIEEILFGILSRIFHFIPADYMVTDIPRPSEKKITSKFP